jgi:hypothetical protein
MFKKMKEWVWPTVEPVQEPVPEPKKPTKPKKVSSTPDESVQQKPAKKPRKKKELSPKEKATKAGEPYVAILKVDIDPNDINNGSFELDWNDKFLVNLIKQGYKVKPDDTDAMIVDRWFIGICRNIALEIHEQYMADPTNRALDDVRRISVKDLGDGRSEIS